MGTCVIEDDVYPKCTTAFTYYMSVFGSKHIMQRQHLVEFQDLQLKSYTGATTINCTAKNSVGRVTFALPISQLDADNTKNIKLQGKKGISGWVWFLIIIVIAIFIAYRIKKRNAEKKKKAKHVVVKDDSGDVKPL